MMLLYTLLLRIATSLFWLAQPFKPKWKKWWEGRSRQEIASWSGNPIIVHCASLGEFEQGRPVIERIKADHPHVPLIVTFFSPSGYEVRNEYAHADAIYYLPVDLPHLMHDFFTRINPRLVIFVKYEYWFNALKVLHRMQIPFIYISVVMGERHFLLSPLLRPLRNWVAKAEKIFVQDDASAQLMTMANFGLIETVGDTRIDRVLRIAEEGKNFPALRASTIDRPCIVYGSLWPADLDIVEEFIKATTDYLHIIAPHDITAGSLRQFHSFFDGPTVKWSQIEEDNLSKIQIVLIDSMGDLAYLYRYAKWAYVGGGFGQGVHSILEPAAYQIPVIFGPKYHHFTEAQALIDLGAVKCVENAREFNKAAQEFGDEKKREAIAAIIGKYLGRSHGATEKIVEYLRQQNLLP